MSAEQVDRRDQVAELLGVPGELVDARPVVRYVPTHRRPGRPEPVWPAYLGLLAVVLSALGGGLLVGVLLGGVLT